MLPNLNYLIEQVGKDKGIPKEIIISTLEEAMLKAAQKRFGLEDDIEAQFNEELGEVELFQFKEVVETVTDDKTQILLEEAHKLDPDAIEGDSIGIKIVTEDFGRIAAQVAKQVIIQRVRAAEREFIFNDYKDRKGDLIAGSVRRIERGNIIVDLGRTEGILLARDQSPREVYRAHDRVLAYVVDVTTTTKGPQIILSRTHEGLLLKLFEMEVPEIAEGIVQIVSCAREPGSRAKIAVISRDSDVDPVGACVGMKGTRVQNIVQELRGEKIDIVTYNPDTVRYVCNALAPAVVSQVLIDEEEHIMEITVPDDQLSLAIGKRGQNVRLASQLTGWKIDIQSESKVEKMAERAREIFQRLDNVNEDLANTLTRLGFLSLEDLVRADIEDLKIIPGLNIETAKTLAEQAAALQSELGLTGELNENIIDEERDRRKKAAAAARVKQPATATTPVDDGRPELQRLKNMDDELMAKLNEAGYYTIEDLNEANFEPKDFSDRFGVSMRKTRAILHSAKVKGGIESEELEEEAEAAEAAAETKPAVQQEMNLFATAGEGPDKPESND
jgi:N utilization substance protein A